MVTGVVPFPPRFLPSILLSRVGFRNPTVQLLDKPWSQVSSLLPPGSCLQFFIAHRVRQSHCSSIFHRVLLTHALAISASQLVHKEKSPRIYTSIRTRGGLELTELTYTRLKDSLIRHRGDRHFILHWLLYPEEQTPGAPITAVVRLWTTVLVVIQGIRRDAEMLLIQVNFAWAVAGGYGCTAALAVGETLSPCLCCKLIACTRAATCEIVAAIILLPLYPG